jgi:hypothetical protein
LRELYIFFLKCCKKSLKKIPFYEKVICNVHKRPITNISCFEDFKINFFVIIYTIKSPTNCILIMTSPYFSLIMQCLKVFFRFIPFVRNNFFYISLFCYTLLCLKVDIKNFIFHITFIYTFIFTINYYHIHFIS